MSFTAPSRGQTILHTHVTQFGQYFAGTNVQEVTRNGNSTSTYADTLRQADTTNGYIARFAYGTSGSPTYMLDVNKTSTLARNFLTRGFKVYDVEAFGDTSDQSGTTDHTTIINAAIQAIRDEASNGVGTDGGAVLRFNRAKYFVSSINATQLDSVLFDCPGGPSTVHFIGSFQQTTSRAVWDLTGSSSCVMRNLIVEGRDATGSYVKTGAAFLIAPSSDSGGIADSNKNEFIGCGSIYGFAMATVELIIGTDNTFLSCAFTNNDAAQPVLHAGLYNRYSIGSAYATISTVGNSWAAASQFGENSFFQCEFHDGYDPGTSTKSTIELDNVQAVRFYGGNVSNHSTSAGAHVRLYGNNQHVTFDGTQFYRDYATNNVRRIFWMSGGPSGSQWITRGLAIRNCSMIGIPNTAAGAGTTTAVLQGDANCLLYDPDIRLLGEAVSSVFQGLETSGVQAILQANSTAASTETIKGGHIDCAGLALNAGGSIGGGTVIARCNGAPAVQAGGHDYSVGITGTGLAIPGGTAATAPGLFFKSAITTGMYLPSANTGAMVASGSEVFRWTNTALTMQNNIPIQPSAVSGTPAANSLHTGNYAKAWVQFNGGGGGATINASYNVTSVTRNNTGLYTITWDRDFSSASYAVGGAAGDGCTWGVVAMAAGTVQIQIRDLANNATDGAGFNTVVAHGLQ